MWWIQVSAHTCYGCADPSSSGAAAGLSIIQHTLNSLFHDPISRYLRTLRVTVNLGVRRICSVCPTARTNSVA